MPSGPSIRRFTRVLTWYDMTASLPMYASNLAGTAALWRYLAGKLDDAGVRDVPPELTWPDDLHAHWKDPELFLSQACGYPLVTELEHHVRVVGTFRYNAAGCSGALCRSVLIARTGEGAQDLRDFRGRTVVYNSTDSQSGYNSLRALVAPMSINGQFFCDQHESGSHRKSVEMVRDGLADIAAIDCVSFAGFSRCAPEVTQGIRVIGYSEPYPGLPLITAGSTSDATLATLRSTLSAAVRDPALSPLLGDLFIKGFEPLDFRDYQTCSDMRNYAIEWGSISL